MPKSTESNVSACACTRGETSHPITSMNIAEYFKRHWYKAGNLLARADRTWLRRLITRCVKPEDFRPALERTPDDIKIVIQFSEV